MTLFLIFSILFQNLTHSDTFYNIYIKGDSIFFAGERGVYLLSSQDDSLISKFTNADSMPLFPYHEIKSKNGDLYITLFGNIICFDLKTEKKYFYPELFLKQGIIRSITFKGDTLIAGGDAGLFLIDTKNTKNTFDDEIIFESRQGYIPGDTVLELFLFNDTLYIGAKTGLFKIHIDSVTEKLPVLHNKIETKIVNKIKFYKNNLYVSSGNSIFLYPDSLLFSIPGTIFSFEIISDTFFITTDKGLYLVYQNTTEMISPDSSFLYDIGIKNRKVYFSGNRIGFYDIETRNFKEIEIRYKELTYGDVSSVNFFKNYYIITLRNGMNIINENLIRENKILSGWIRSSASSNKFLIATKWCGEIYVFDSLLNLIDTINTGYCIQHLEFIDDSTFFVLKPASNSLEIMNVKGEKIDEIFNLGFLTDIERYTNFYIGVNKEGDIFKIYDDFSYEKVLNIGTPIYDLTIYQEKIYLATPNGINIYSLPDFNFRKQITPSDPYTVSVISDKKGNIFALSRSGLILIKGENLNKIFTPGPNSITETQDLDENLMCSASLLKYVEEKGILLIGTRKGISIFNLKDISPVLTEEKILVFPNPFYIKKGYFYLKTDSPLKELYLFSVSGKRKRLNFINLNDKYKIMVNNLNPGLFILEVRTEKGNYFKKILGE